jgi:hypothetical protein
MVAPQQQISSAEQDWAGKGNPVNSSIRMEGGWSFGPFGGGQQRVQRVLFENGETWDIPDEGEPQLVDFNSSMNSAWRAQNKAPAGPSYVSASSSTPGYFDPTTGETRDNPYYQPQAASSSVDQWQDPQTGAIYNLDAQGNKGEMLSSPIAGWIPGYGVQAPSRAAPLSAEDQRLKQLQIQKAEQGLMSPYALAQQQTQEAITAIQQQLARGEITVEEANRLMALTRANLEAAMQGTSPYQMEQDRLAAERSERQQRQSIASNIIDRSVSSGTSMANSLLSGASGIYGGILSSSKPPTNFDPLAMAKAYTDELGGGPEMSQMAQAILRGAMQGGM